MIYNTKDEAVHALIDSFNRIPSWFITDNMNLNYENWTIYEQIEEWDDEKQDYTVDYTDYGEFPMWGWVWDPSTWIPYEWMNEHRHELMDIGFTIIENEYEDFWCLGINGAGYDFYEAHWTPLYDLYGFKWHKEN